MDLLLIPRGRFTGLPVKDLFRDRWVCITGADNPHAEMPYALDDVGELRWGQRIRPVSATLADRQIDDIIDFGQHTDVVVDALARVAAARGVRSHPVRDGAGTACPRVPVPLSVTDRRPAGGSSPRWSRQRGGIHPGSSTPVAAGFSALVRAGGITTWKTWTRSR